MRAIWAPWASMWDIIWACKLWTCTVFCLWCSMTVPSNACWRVAICCICDSKRWSLSDVSSTSMRSWGNFWSMDCVTRSSISCQLGATLGTALGTACEGTLGSACCQGSLVSQGSAVLEVAQSSTVHWGPTTEPDSVVPSFAESHLEIITCPCGKL